MLSIMKSMSLNGINGYLVEVQVDISEGMPYFEIIGLPDTSVRESKERVKTAIKNSGYKLLSRKIIINLAPADIRKEGTFFDLPMAIGILIAIEELDKTTLKDFEKTIFLGELSLDGKINSINGVLPMCIEAMKLGIKKVIIPKENEVEASIIKGIDIIPVTNLLDVINYIKGKKVINKNNSLNNFNLENENRYMVDFSEVKGQENAKRALEIAAAGGHNCLLIGSPGSGKTMLSERLITILPDLTFEEALEITKIHSISGEIEKGGGLRTIRPFRRPHHTSSPVSIIGGGRIPKPGEISLAHFGVLFLDELPEFKKSTLEVLRGPLEDGNVTISRVNSTLTYPCNFMLIASMNPCPCGYYGTDDSKCNCKESSIQKYIGQVSGPLLDRIDLHIEVKPVEYKKVSSDEKVESSAEIKKRVNNARKIQLERYKGLNIYSNSELTPNLIERYCKLDKNSKIILEMAFERLGLSGRAYGRILKVARTIADLDSSEKIEQKHVAEAIQYRNLDRKYWKRG